MRFAKMAAWLQEDADSLAAAAVGHDKVIGDHPHDGAAAGARELTGWFTKKAEGMLGQRRRRFFVYDREHGGCIPIA